MSCVIACDSASRDPGSTTQFVHLWHEANDFMTSLGTMTNDDPVSAAHCRLCELADSAVTHPKAMGDIIAVHTDRDLVVFIQPPQQAFGVAPAGHVEDLSALDEGMLGAFLGALRRVAVHVRSMFGCLGTVITPIDGALPECGGHVSFRLLPSFHEEGSVPTKPTEPMVQAELLAERLG